MQQLSWTDDMMLRAETPATPLQIQLLLIYDPSTAPGGKVTFKGILEELDARLHLADVFRRRLTELPGGLHRPYWVEDPNFDLEYHVRHIGLPQPGDWRQLCIQIARLFARQIDLRRPPWEITVIEGLNSVPGVPKGSFAMALKLHHCAVDGMASVQMIAALHDLAADSPRPAGPDSPWRPGPLPSTADLLSRTAINVALYPLRAGAVLASSAPKVVRGLAGLPAKLVGGVVSQGRRAAVCRRFHRRPVSTKRCRRTASSRHGFTISPISNGSRRACPARRSTMSRSPMSAAPFASIWMATASFPMNRSLRRARSHCARPAIRAVKGTWCSAGCNHSVPTSPIRSNGSPQSLNRPQEAVPGSDQSTRTQLLELIGTVPTSLLGMTAKAASVLPFSGPTVANTTVTNVPGPTEPIFFSGARLVRAAGLGPLVGGLNLIHVVASYNGTLSISATADRDSLPDPASYAECMEKAFQELLAGAGAAPIGS